MKEYPPSEQCKICQGKCCKGMPGSWVPDDIKRIFPSPSLEESVELALKTKRFAIDWYEDRPPIFYLRPATKGKEGVRRDPSWGGECTFLTKDGCELFLENRPFICRISKPKAKQSDGCRTYIKGNQKLYVANIWDASEVNLGKM